MINMYDLAKKILAETDGQICKQFIGRKLSNKLYCRYHKQT